MLGRPATGPVAPAAVQAPAAVHVVSPDAVVCAAVTAGLAVTGCVPVVAHVADHAPGPGPGERLVLIAAGGRLPATADAWAGRRVVAAGGSPAARALVRAARRGAAVVDADVPLGALVDALRARLAVATTPDDTARAVAVLQRADDELTRLRTLTRGERRVLVALMDGSTVGDVARDQHVSPTTVRAHVRAILRKLQVTHQLAAVAVAHRVGGRAAPLVNLDDVAPVQPPRR